MQFWKIMGVEVHVERNCNNVIV